MTKQRNLVGNKYGKLTVIKMLGNKGKGHYKSLVICECGRKKEVRDSSLIYGRSLSCGCGNATHGLTKTRLFNIWQTMRSRCYCKTSSGYKGYGGRGITICDEWKNDFLNFYNWSMKNGYKDKLTIDRIDNSKGYFPDNCRWATNIQQANNKKNNVYITYKNKTMSISDWARKLNINKGSLYTRYRKGWRGEKLFSNIDRLGENEGRIQHNAKR